nr:Rne/Rng family ribonuclease [Bifidobacterium sp. DSM 109957]
MAQDSQPSAQESAGSAVNANPAPRRRRGGRRVVRGAGAAGASLELHVQEHPATPLFEAPVLPEPSVDNAADKTAKANTADKADTTETNQHDHQDDTKAEEPAAPRRTRRTRAAAAASDDDGDDHAAPRTRRRSTRVSDDDADERDEARPTRRRTRAMDDDMDRDDHDDHDDRPSARRRSRVTDDDDMRDDDRPTARRRSRVSDDDDDVRDDDRPSSHRRARLTDDDDDRPSVRRRSRTLAHDMDDDDDDDEPRQIRRRSTRNADADERLLDAVDMLPVGHEPTRQGRPMTSLLFQEPVLPVRRPVDDDIEVDNRANRMDHDAHDDRDDHTEHDDADDTEATGRGRSRRSRRLNAQERRAAAEVEQIEEDLELDDIAYMPIAEGESDDEGDSSRRSRRRRRRGSRTEAAARATESNTENSEADDNADEESAVSTRSRRRSEDEEDDEQTVTRRRRRRRGAKAESEDENEQPLVRRSRKQQYIDEITDVEGSTRLEAKKQRRRDNRRERSRQSQLMEQDFLARRENVDRLMVVREKEQHTQISVVEDNVLVEHYVSDIQEVQTVGNIYLGRVQNVLPSMEAAFVDIGQARNGVLYAGEVNWDAARLEGQPRRIELAFKSGDPVLVQVTKDPIGHKGARLTSQVTLAGRFLVLVPSGGMTGVSRKLSERERSRLKNIVSKIAPKDMGVIIRTAAEGASEEAITKDLESLVRQWERINAKREEFWHGKRPKLLQGEPDVAIRVVRDIFNDDFNKLIVEGDKVYDRIEEYLDTMAPDLKDKLERWDPAEHEGKDVFDKWQIDSQLRKGMERQVYLPSGGSIVIDRTEAMTTIDVNTGRFIGRGKSLEETVTRCNLEASEEIARQLRLRDIGGMVMIDFVDMVMPANRDLVLRRLVECLARDRTKHQVAEVTSLGLVQMTRKRIGQGLVEAFSEECPTCKGRGFILHDKPTVSADYDDPYAMRGGDPFVRTNKHGRGTSPAPEPAGSSADVKAKLAQIAAAAVAANSTEN